MNIYDLRKKMVSIIFLVRLKIKCENWPCERNMEDFFKVEMINDFF